MSKKCPVLNTHKKNISIQRTLQFVAHYYRVKNSESSSKATIDNIKKFQNAIENVKKDKKPRIKAAIELIHAIDGGIEFVGRPVEDWCKALNILQNINALSEILRNARMVRLFRATDVLASGLGDLWLDSGNYKEASSLVKKILNKEHLLAANRDPRGCILMNIHKSKGKEFDAVILVEGSFVSKFVSIR